MRRLPIAAILLILSVTLPSPAQLPDIFKRGDSNRTSTLSDDKIAGGLKEALQVGASNAVALTGKPDGYLKNADIHIPLPDKLKTVGKGMRMMGMGAQVDELETGMNRAAEQAAPKAKAIFVAAIKKMSFEDARQILSGGNNAAATEYFKRTCTADLSAQFSPIVHQSMENVGVVKQYNALMQSAPGGRSLAGSFDLDKYVVGKALDGLFLMLGREEQKIRTNPAAQTTSLLKQVFGRK